MDSLENPFRRRLETWSFFAFTFFYVNKGSCFKSGSSGATATFLREGHSPGRWRNRKESEVVVIGLQHNQWNCHNLLLWHQCAIRLRWFVLRLVEESLVYKHCHSSRRCYVLWYDVLISSPLSWSLRHLSRHIEVKKHSKWQTHISAMRNTFCYLSKSINSIAWRHQCSQWI